MNGALTLAAGWLFVHSVLYRQQAAAAVVKSSAERPHQSTRGEGRVFALDAHSILQRLTDEDIQSSVLEILGSNVRARGVPAARLTSASGEHHLCVVPCGRHADAGHQDAGTGHDN